MFAECDDWRCYPKRQELRKLVDYYGELRMCQAAGGLEQRKEMMDKCRPGDAQVFIWTRRRSLSKRRLDHQPGC